MGPSEYFQAYDEFASLTVGRGIGQRHGAGRRFERMIILRSRFAALIHRTGSPVFWRLRSMRLGADLSTLLPELWLVAAHCRCWCVNTSPKAAQAKLRTQNTRVRMLSPAQIADGGPDGAPNDTQKPRSWNRAVHSPKIVIRWHSRLHCFLLRLWALVARLRGGVKIIMKEP